VNAALPRYGLTPAQLLAWVRDSCVSQGVPVVVSDPGVLSQVGVLLGAPRRKPSGGRSAATAATRDARGAGQTFAARPAAQE